MIARTAKVTAASLYAMTMIGLFAGMGVIATDAPLSRTGNDPAVGFALVMLLKR